MANIKSQIKRNKQAEVARDRNRTVKSALRTEVKKFNASLMTTVEEAAANLKTVTVLLDKAASDKVIHANEASRKKSTLTKKYNVMVANPPVPAPVEEKPAKSAKAAAKKPAAKKPAATPTKKTVGAGKSAAEKPAAKKPAAKKPAAKK